MDNLKLFAAKSVLLLSFASNGITSFNSLLPFRISLHVDKNDKFYLNDNKLYKNGLEVMDSLKCMRIPCDHFFHIMHRMFAFEIFSNQYHFGYIKTAWPMRCEKQPMSSPVHE